MRIDRDGTIIRDNGDRLNDVRSRLRATRLPRPRRAPADASTVVFYIITITLSVVVSFLMAYFVSECLSEDFLGAIIGFFMFLAGIAGCLCYNIFFSCLHDAWEGFLSVLSAFGAALIIGVIFFVLLPVVVIAIVAIAVIAIIVCAIAAFH